MFVAQTISGRTGMRGVSDLYQVSGCGLIDEVCPMPAYGELVLRLDQIVDELQRCSDLDELIRLYEEGQRLHHQCQRTLDDAEKRLRDCESSAA